MLTRSHIWKERNSRLFEGQTAGTSVIAQHIIDDADCIDSSSRRRFFPAGVCLPDQTDLIGLLDQSDRSKQSQQSQVLKFEEKSIHLF